jgi:lipase ATG15
LGKSIIYDTVSRFHWQVDVRHHVIKEIIERVLEEEGEWEDGRDVPIARVEDNCVVSTNTAEQLAELLKKNRQDCYKWEFIESDVSLV